MKSRNTPQNYYRFYLFSVVGTLLASAYPLYMGAKVVVDMLRNGTVNAEDYPKYVIPYTPISLAILLAVDPLCRALCAAVGVRALRRCVFPDGAAA